MRHASPGLARRPTATDHRAGPVDQTRSARTRTLSGPIASNQASSSRRTVRTSRPNCGTKCFASSSDSPSRLVYFDDASYQSADSSRPCFTPLLGTPSASSAPPCSRRGTCNADAAGSAPAPQCTTSGTPAGSRRVASLPARPVARASTPEVVGSGSRPAKTRPVNPRDRVSQLRPASRLLPPFLLWGS
jgi:hypothetical protein